MTLTGGFCGCSDDDSFSLEGGEDDDNMLLDFLREENAAKCAPAIYLSIIVKICQDSDYGQ